MLFIYFCEYLPSSALMQVTVSVNINIINTKKHFLKLKKIPWLSIMKDRHVLALFVGHVTSEWVYFLFLTCLPMFMKEVLQFDISSV